MVAVSSQQAHTLFPPVIGRFVDGRGEFHGDDKRRQGHPGALQLVSTTADSARWEQAFPVDEGKTWVTNWIMDLTRRPD